MCGVHESDLKSIGGGFSMNEDVRVGVFVCDCGSNIASVVNVPEVVEYAKGLDKVVIADEGRWSCSVDYLNKLQTIIKDNQVNRVVIASCTPRTHEPLFKRSVKEAGVNPYLLEFVSIREQVSWVHMKEPEIATAKAKDLIRMGVAKAILLEEGQEIRLPVQTECMVIGGGMAGMTAALNVANQGFKAIIVEKAPELGGKLNEICFVSHHGHRTPAAKLAQRKVEQVTGHPNIKVYTGTEIESVEGYIGNFNVKLKNNGNGAGDSFKVSTVVVATGMREVPPEGLLGYGKDSRVITQLELEGKLKNKELKDLQDVVMVNCVNSKNETRGCCNVGCHVSVKNALALKTLNPQVNISILYRDLSMIKEEHEDLEKAKRAGIKFLRFRDDQYPEVTTGGDRLSVKSYDILAGREFSLEPDLLVLTTAFQGDETVDHVRGLMKVSANKQGFFQESHVKLGPLEFPTSGVSLCGCAKSPMLIKESTEEGIGAAMRVSIPMKKGFIEAEGIVADMDLTNCNQCGLCSKKCPYNAIKVAADGSPEVIKALCKGCGLCAADCPKECISIVHYSDAQILAQVDAALVENPSQKIIAFVCHWCALGGVDMAGVSRLQYPSNARLIRVMCSARVSIKMISHAFEKGAAGVLVAGCEFPTCHYISGNYEAEKRVGRAKKKLSKAGFDPEKLQVTWCSAADGPKFANVMRNMCKELDLR
jgi:heterodisulfide reductase subunit A2